MGGGTPAIEGLYNFRDTGGMPLRGGGTTRAGVLFRSDALSALTTAGEVTLAATPIGVIVDFRTPEERQAAPDRLPTSRSFRSVDLSILAGATADMAKKFLTQGPSPSPEAIAQAMANMPTLAEMYVAILQTGGTAFVEVARLIAASSDDQPTAVLVHCTAGKDRTGIATALMLEAAGAERGAVIDDYAASQKNLEGAWADGMIHMVTSFGLPMTPAFRTLLTGTPPAAMEEALRWVDQRGGAAAYLQAAGLTDAELAALRTRMAA